MTLLVWLVLCVCVLIAPILVARWNYENAPVKQEKQGYDYAKSQLLLIGKVYRGLRSEASGEYDLDYNAYKHPFNRGMQRAIEEYDNQEDN